MGRKRHIILSCFKPAFNLKIRLRGLDRLKGIKILFKYGEERSIVCDCTHEEKIIFFRFCSKWLLWKPATPFWGFNLSIDSIDASSSCSSIKQDLTFKQAHFASFWFFSVKWATVLAVDCCFQCFLQALSGNSLFCNKPKGQNDFLVSRDRCQMLRLFWVISTRHYWSLITPSFRNFSLIRILSKVESYSWSQLVQK